MGAVAIIGLFNFFQKPDSIKKLSFAAS